jgi:hypothetical protein
MSTRVHPLKTPANIAPKARIEVSSSHPDYDAKGAVDGRVGGFPGDIAEEWASKEEAVGAWIRLSWDQPRRIDRIQLFDRPNNLDQITGGRLDFDDGSTIPVDNPLADDASEGLEIDFQPREVKWVKFTVTAVKEKTQNVGLSEIGVIESRN